jgi:hypothetical protein
MRLASVLMRASPAPAPTPVARTKSSGGRSRGLVHGTGRAKALSTQKRSNSKANVAPAPFAPLEPAAPMPAAPPVAVAVPTKTRTVIDQGPTPLYCSDECRLADMYEQGTGYAFDFNPDRHRPARGDSVASALRPVRASSQHSDPESVASSADTDCSSASGASRRVSARTYEEMGPSIATLADAYGWRPLEAPLPAPAPARAPAPASEMPFGTIMAARRRKAILNPEQPASASGRYTSPAARYTASRQQAQRQPVPGWTDGSDAWRADVYSMSPPRDWTKANPFDPDNRAASYGTVSALSHRPTAAVVSTASEHPLAPAPATSAPGPDTLRSAYRGGALREASSPLTAFFPGPSSLPARSGSLAGRTTREVGILPPQAEGRLLVPDVKLKRTTSTGSVALSSSAPLRSPRGGPRALRRRGSALSDDTIPEECEPVLSSSAPLLSGVRRLPIRESYRSLLRRIVSDPGFAVVAEPEEEPFMYDIPLPMKTVKRVERHVVDGVKQSVTVEVRVRREIQPLFLGPGQKLAARERYKAQRAGMTVAARDAAATARSRSAPACA